MTITEQLEKLKDELWESKIDMMGNLTDNLEELSTFRLGWHQGYVQSCDDMIEHLRKKLKYEDLDCKEKIVKDNE